MTTPLELDPIREMLRDLDAMLGLQGSFRPLDRRAALALDSPEQLEEMFGDLLVGVLGLEVAGL